MIMFIRCYIDDFLFICTKQVGNISEWFLYLNDNDLNLRFTGIMDLKQVEFPDFVLMGRGIKFYLGYLGNRLLAIPY